jgi:hypothetical protein
MRSEVTSPKWKTQRQPTTTSSSATVPPTSDYTTHNSPGDTTPTTQRPTIESKGSAISTSTERTQKHESPRILTPRSSRSFPKMRTKKEHIATPHEPERSFDPLPFLEHKEPSTLSLSLSQRNATFSLSLPQRDHYPTATKSDRAYKHRTQTRKRTHGWNIDSLKMVTSRQPEQNRIGCARNSKRQHPNEKISQKHIQNGRKA